MIRKFRMVGLDTGTNIDLNNYSKYLLTLPEGLGIELKNTYLSIGNKKIKVSQNNEYKPIKGVIEITGAGREEWEKNYNELKKFVAKNKSSGVRLYYQSTSGENTEKYVDCFIKILSKTEKSRYCIRSDVEFEVTSNWKKDVETIVNTVVKPISANTVAFIEGVYYTNDSSVDVDDNFYGFLYDEGTEEHCCKYTLPAYGEVSLSNSGDAEIPLKLIIFGPCLNPYIQLEDTNGNVVQECRIYGELNEDGYISYNSDPSNLFIEIVTESGNLVITNSVDTSLKTFLTLPIGDYTLRIKEDNEEPIGGQLSYSLEYLGG